jgi:hypothetical protein
MNKRGKVTTQVEDWVAVRRPQPRAPAVLPTIPRRCTESTGGRNQDQSSLHVFDGTPVRLIVQPGIRKPASLDAALTIRTTWSTS